MTSSYRPSPNEGVRQQVALYEATDGVAEQFWPHFPEYRASAGDRDIPIMLVEQIASSCGESHSEPNQGP